MRLEGPEIPKYVYVHTPARYLWAPELDGRGDNLAARLAGPALRHLDRRTSEGATSIAANSRFVAERVERSWGRTAEVIHPPVGVAGIQAGGWRDLLTDAERRTLDELPESFVLGVSRFIPYKRLDAVIQVGETLGEPVVIAGFGPLEKQLRAMGADASVPVRMLTLPSDAMVSRAHGACLAVRLPADRGLRHRRGGGDGRRHAGHGEQGRRCRRIGP